MEARNSRTFRSPPPPPAQKGATKTVQVDDLLASASNETPKKRKLFRRLCRCKMLSSKKKRKQFPRRVAIVSLTLTILCGIALAIAWAAMDQVCDTPACIVAAARAVSFMDQSVNPCDDFYEFACRGLRENSSSLRVNGVNPLHETLNADYDRILTGQIQPKALDPTLKPLYEEIKRIHKGCMEGTLNSTYVPFQSIFTSGDVKNVVAEGHKFAYIFWDPSELSKGNLRPAPPIAFDGTPWQSIYDASVASPGYEPEEVKFTGNQLNVVFRHLANWTSVLSESRPMQAESPVSIFNFSFFEALDNYVSTNPQGLVQNISQAVDLAILEVAQNIGITERDERSRLDICRTMLQQTYGDAIFQLWLFHRYVPTHGETAQNIATKLQHIFNQRITDNEWLDEASKAIVKNKVAAMKFLVGQGPVLQSPEKLLRHYSTSDILPDIYKIRQLALSSGGRSSLHLMANVNAFFLQFENSVNIPFTILREPLFTLETSISMQYGSIGFIIGHEITHALDASGIRVSHNGTFNPQSIITAESISKFSDRATCFIEKYSGYKEANATVNGMLTISENIADNGGLHSAWQAYQAEKTARGPFQKRVRLPSLSFTDEQLFFISFAQTWCSAKSDASIREQILTDEHSPEKTRVNAGLSLFEPFAKTFNCPASSNMNPSKRCRMWKRGVPVS